MTLLGVQKGLEEYAARCTQGGIDARVDDGAQARGTCKHVLDQSKSPVAGGGTGVVGERAVTHREVKHNKQNSGG